MSNVFDVLKERGYIDQVTHEEELRDLLGKEPITFYIGFDATADSLTLGHFLQIMVMMHMQKHGHKPIALLGGGTTMIGDPSGRNNMRSLMTKEFIDHNVECFRNQLTNFLDFSDDKAFFVNNADWLLNLNYLEFMRDVGTHFTINRMLSFDAYKNRLEDGLTFFEFGYMPLQSYDYLHLFREYNCRLQLGGSDQWSNMIGGFELVRKIEQEKVYSMTFSLLTTAAGVKMGKTEKGTVWLDPNKTPPYELYQYLRNVDDRDVIKFLKLLTFVSLEEIEDYSKLEGADINKAKERLAFEVTKTIHGEEEASKAEAGARALFSGKQDEGSIPFTEMKAADFENAIGILDLLKDLGLTKSNGEGRRLVEQGGISIDDVKVEDITKEVSLNDFKDNKILIKKGKKVYHQVRLV